MSDPNASAPVVLRYPAPLLIAGFSAAGYWLAHSYESAYLGQFDIPASLVRVGINTTIIATGSLLSVAGLAFAAAVYVVGLVPKKIKTHWSHVAFFMMTIAVFQLVANAILFWAHWRVLFVAAIVNVLAIALAIAWIVDEIARKKKGLQPEQPPQVNPVDSLVPWIGVDGVLAAFILFQAFMVARSAGRAAAMDQVDFMTLDEPAGFVVLRSYDDMLVAARLNRDTRSIGREVTLISPAKVAAVHLRIEAVGPLHVEPVSVPRTNADQPGRESADAGAAAASPPRDDAGAQTPAPDAGSAPARDAGTTAPLGGNRPALDV